MNKNKIIHLYFDWNIFKYIKTPRKGNENDKKFAQLIESIKDYIFIAYSPFHISGLLKNYDESKYQYILDDCELITKITNNLCIYKDGNSIKLEYRDPLNMFNNQVNSSLMNKQLLESNSIFGLMTNEQKQDFENNYLKIKNDETLKDVDNPYYMAFINSNDPEGAFKSILEIQDKLQTDPETYIKVRSGIVEYKEKYKKLSKSEKELISTKLTEYGINKDLNELDEKDFMMISKNILNGKEDTGISNLYTFKDLFGITKPEKISNKNSFKNIIDDSFHLDMAQSALYYISEDKNNLEKAKLINDENNLGMEILNIDQAIKKIGVSLYTKK